MSTRHATTPHAVVLKGLRVFSVQFFCDECNNQFIDEMLTVSHSWCPCCDAKCEPDGIEEYEVETDEEDEEEGYGPSLYTTEEMGRLKGIV